MIGVMSHLPGLFMQTLSLRDLYFQWEAAGIFDFFLPALLIFSLIFGILTATKVLGTNRGITFLISFAIAVIAIRVPFVSNFFTTIFPNFAVGLVVVIIVLILMGLFVNEGNLQDFSNTMMWGGLGIGAIVAIITFNQYDWFGSFWWQENWVTVVFVIILVLVIMPLLMPPKTDKEKEEIRKGFKIPIEVFRK